MGGVSSLKKFSMSLWEYKVITSGKGGFATPAMLDKFLNDLGRDEWEIIQYHAAPDNLLAFTGLARRSTQRDWTLQDAAAAAAKAEADKLRAEFSAKFEAATRPAPAAGPEAAPASFIEEKTAPDDGFRKPVDTSRDDDPEAHDEGKDDWDKLTTAEEEELPVFFDAIKPHLRRNQRGPGMSVGTDYLAKKWDQTEDDIKGALVECGFVLPADEDSRPEYLEFDGDLYWLNINRRGELWINTKEKPRPVFRAVKGTRIEPPAEEPRPEPAAPAADQPAAKPHFEPRARREREEAAAAPATPDAAPASEPATPGAPLPGGSELLNTIRPLMRRNRRGPGGSGSATFLARALKRTEADLIVAFAALGLTVPAHPNDKPLFVELDGDIWWLNLDSRGGLWINGREKKDGEVLTPAAAPASPAESASVPAAVTEPAPTQTPVASAPASAPTGNVFAAVRLLLKETKTGSVAGKLDRVAGELGQSPEDFLAALIGAGLKAPEKAREKPVFVEHAGEIFWLNRNAKDELWLNAKASKFTDKGGESGAVATGGEKKTARRSGGGGGGRSRK